MNWPKDPKGVLKHVASYGYKLLKVLKERTECFGE